MVTPLTVNIMLACYVSPDPAEVLGVTVWSSSAAKAERGFLINEDMITVDNGDWIVTDRGKAWIERMLATPLSVAEFSCTGRRERGEAPERRARMTDGPISPEDDALSDVMIELDRAQKKFPGRAAQLAALMEEVGELATALMEEKAHDVRKEAIQVAVVAIRIAIDGDETLDAWRARKGLDQVMRTRCA